VVRLLEKEENIMIKYIIHTFTSKRDTSGNCYNYSIITSTKTKHCLTVNDGWGSDGGNTVSQVKRLLGLEWHEVYVADRDNMPKREHRIKADNCDMLLHDLTAKDLKRLDRKYQ